MASNSSEDSVIDKENTKMAYKAAISSFLGTFLEFYDYTLFGFLAVIIGPLFFPSSDTTTTLLYYFAVFGIGFLMRPLGAWFWGMIGDKYIGRRNTIIITILLMGIVSVGMGLLPTYSEIGIWATVALVSFRLLQGFSLGGEFGGGITLTAELAPKERRGFFVGIAQLAQAGILTTGLLYVFTSIMSKAAFQSYGWRILFIIGVIIAVVGFYIRTSIVEPKEFTEIKQQKKTAKVPISVLVLKYPKQFLLGIFLGGLPLSYTFITYGVTYLNEYVKFSYTMATLITLIASVIYFLVTLPSAYMTDRIGRKKIVLIGMIGEAVLVIPFYYLLGTGIFLIVLALYMIEETLHGIYNGAYAQMMAEIFPTNIRYTGIAFSYNVGVGILGGFTPFILTFLIGITHDVLAPIWWLMPLIIIPIILTILWYKETCGIDLGAI